MVVEDITKVIERPEFTILRKPLKFSRTNGYYNCYPGNVPLNKNNILEQEVNLWCKWGKTAENLYLVEYGKPAFIQSSFAGWTDTIYNISRLTEREKVHENELNENNRPMLLGPEQKSEELIKTFVNKHNTLVDLVSDTFSESHSTGRTRVNVVDAF